LDTFPARAPKAPSPAHAAPVTAPEIAPLNAPSANPSRNDPPFIAAAIPPTAPLSSSGQCSPECSCQYDSQYPACQSRRYPNPAITTAATTILAMDFHSLYTTPQPTLSRP